MLASSMNNRFKFRVWDFTINRFDTEIYQAGEQFGHPSSCDWIAQQYTGLTDSNDNPIYEGDILKISYGTMGDVIGQVLYEADHGGHIFQWERKGPNQHHINLNCDVAFESVIIGNIFETPQLLK
jgi:uncharacterized phage protein (TIGR01671 family)